MTTGVTLVDGKCCSFHLGLMVLHNVMVKEETEGDVELSSVFVPGCWAGD